MTTQLPERPYITCRELIDFLADYLDGELSPDQRFELERHLAVCPSCVHYLDTYKLTIRFSPQAMHSDEVEDLPEDLVRGILSARSQA